MRKLSYELELGDVLMMTWCGPRMIIDFREYKGPHDFVERIAVLHDRTRMSIERGHVYDVLDPAVRRLSDWDKRRV